MICPHKSDQEPLTAKVSSGRSQPLPCRTARCRAHVPVWSPMTAGPFLVPVTRWVE